MNKQEIQALQRPFVKELFRKNKFNLVMTVIAAFLASVAAGPERQPHDRNPIKLYGGMRDEYKRT